jgi:hypothetical protein
MDFYFISLLILKILIGKKFIRGSTFYFVFWRSTIIIFSLISIAAFLLNSILTVHYFRFDISNFLIPALDLLYFFLFLIFFISLVGKYIPSVSDKYFSVTTNILIFFSLLYSILNLFFLVKGQNVDLTVKLFPFGILIKYTWVVGPLFGAFYWSKLTKKQKEMLLISILLLLLLNIPSGRRSLLIFIISFLTFWCWRTNYLKKISLILILGFLYFVSVAYHVEFKYLTNKNLKLIEKIEIILNSDQSSFKPVDRTINRVLHKYRLIEPVYYELLETEAVGFKPLKSAIYAPIPSRFLQEKPWPGSIDGQRYSSFGYLVNDIAFNQSYNMSEYPISLKFMWFGSLPIVFTGIALSILIISLIYRVSIFFGDRLVILPLLTVYPGDYNYFEPELSDLYQTFSYVYIPGFFVLVFLVIMKILSVNTKLKNKKQLSTRSFEK